MLGPCGSRPTCRPTEEGLLTSPSEPCWAPDLRCMPDPGALLLENAPALCGLPQPGDLPGTRAPAVHRPLAADDMLVLPGTEPQTDAAGSATTSASMLLAARLASSQITPAGNLSLKHCSSTAAAALCQESNMF